MCQGNGGGGRWRAAAQIFCARSDLQANLANVRDFSARRPSLGQRRRTSSGSGDRGESVEDYTGETLLIARNLLSLLSSHLSPSGRAFA